MLITGIKSRPIYTVLEPDLSGRFHLLVGQGSGGAALIALLQHLPVDAPKQIIYATESFTGENWQAKLQSAGASDVHSVPTQTEAIAELEVVLSKCVMGTRLYIAGSESFIGSAVQVSVKYDMHGDEVQREHRGTAARRVHCIHCKAANENVTTNIVQCSGCGRHLLVRDHYSRRLAGYMGVMVDAEVPGTIPPLEEVFGWSTQKPSPSS